MTVKIITLSLIVLLLGCGQTGPLYLPDSPAPIHVEKNQSIPVEKSPSSSNIR